MPLRRKLAGLAEELRRDNSPGDKLLRVAQRSVHSFGLHPHVDVTRRVIVELRQPPKVFRGLRDLIVRRGLPTDERALMSIDDTDRQTVLARFRRNDLAFVGTVDGEVLCHTWFHRGPEPFLEDRQSCASWALDEGTFWSYNGAARIEARSSGVFVKLFQNALVDMFEKEGAKRIQGFIHDTNTPSLTMHARLGWVIIGTITCVAAPGVKWLKWEGSGRSRQWIVRRSSDFELALPPP